MRDAVRLHRQRIGLKAIISEMEDEAEPWQYNCRSAPHLAPYRFIPIFTDWDAVYRYYSGKGYMKNR